MKYLVVLPAFNEAHTIGSVIREIRTSAPFADIVVINDGSTDGTAGIASAGGAMVVNLPFNLGYGAALQTGFRFGVRGGYDLIIMMDADGQHNPASVGSLIEAMREHNADVVIGSRFLQGSYRMSVARKIGSRIFSHIARAYTGIRITDPTSGFQLLNREAFAYLAEGDNYPLDYPDVNIIMALHKRDFRIAEAPVVMTENSTGKSMHDGLRPLYYVVKMFLAIVMVLMKRRGR
ncbi:MAG: glycosyltransferase family 2 protein [Nitrospiraceae bacterium]|nr:glycosyltransferase family 2 protein [Nitrospiraceae bacterium]